MLTKQKHVHAAYFIYFSIIHTHTLTNRPLLCTKHKEPAGQKRHSLSRGRQPSARGHLCHAVPGPKPCEVACFILLSAPCLHFPLSPLKAGRLTEKYKSMLLWCYWGTMWFRCKFIRGQLLRSEPPEHVLGMKTLFHPKSAHLMVGLGEYIRTRRKQEKRNAAVFIVHRFCFTSLELRRLFRKELKTNIDIFQNIK